VYQPGLLLRQYRPQPFHLKEDKVLKTLFTSRLSPISVVYWSPSLAAGAVALIAFVLLGHTPVVRALGFAAAISGVTLTLRRFGATLAITGGLALAFSPAFWFQTGGEASVKLTLVALALGCAMFVVITLVWFRRTPEIGLGIGIIVFAILFWFLVGTTRSLRVTTFLSAWLLYLIIDILLIANPRPEDPPPIPLQHYHTWGIFLLLGVGIWNDALFILFAPAVILTLLLSRTRLSGWYWGLLSVVVVAGLWALIHQYIDSGWWHYPSARAEALNLHISFVLADGWRQASRWLYLINLVSGQFTPLGVLLGILGLARLARWYPSLGLVTMTAYAAYGIFGLGYFGADSTVLLLPLLMIQMIWMTYAVYSFSHWMQKSLKTEGVVRWLAPAAFTLLPLGMLFRIVGVL
jgi:hypothetical protein